MNLSAKLIALTQPTIKIDIPNAEALLAYCARVSNPSNQNNEEYEKLLNYCITHKHWSIFQMVNAVVEIIAPRDISRQFTRHGSLFTVEGDILKEEQGFDTSQGGIQEFSQRYSNQIQFTDREWRGQDTKNRQNSIDNLSDEVTIQADMLLEMSKSFANASYFAMTKEGIAKECARVILPEGLTMSRLYVNGTLRSWLHYLDVRMANGTQKEHTDLAKLILAELKPAFPTVFKNWSNYGS